MLSNEMLREVNGSFLDIQVNLSLLLYRYENYITEVLWRSLDD